MLRHRLIFGPIMIGLLVAAFYADDQLDRIDIAGTWAQTLFAGRNDLPAGLLMLFVFLVLCALGARELVYLVAAKGIAVSPLMVWLSGTVGLLLIYILPYQLDSQVTIAIYASVMAVLFGVALLLHTRGERTEGAIAVASSTMFAFLYMGVLPGFYLAIRRWHSAWLVAAIILVCKSFDIGAYFTGRAVGRHKLIPWLSPGKTWEGLIGGAVTSGVVAVLLAEAGNVIGLWKRWVDAEGAGGVFEAITLPLWPAAVAGVVIGLVGQAGDLMASLFKRDAGIKDSGRSIPGFGGIIDVIDSPIIVAPVAYWLLKLLDVMTN
jgi:phosphatidate cytidylyltransferase